MTAVAFPIAATAEAALARPLGRAARESQAVMAAGEAVAFVTEPVGPAFTTREAALDAFPGKLDDERPGRGVSVQPEDRFCQLRELAASPPHRRKSDKGVQPTFKDGRRWPAPPPPPQTVWRLSISYWRVGAAAQPAPAAPEPLPHRRGRVDADPAALRRRAAEPLRPVKPQQPLDIGLFEFRPPEAPHIVMPDE